MLYRTYRMYNNCMEIMVPSSLSAGTTSPIAQYHWQSEDKKVVVDVARGGADLDEEGLYERLNEYYKGFCKDITNFQCLHIEKRSVNGHAYGELRYTSDMMGYRFYNVFMLGALEGRELVLTLQCMDKDVKSHLHIFEIISDSIRILRNNNTEKAGGTYDSED